MRITPDLLADDVRLGEAIDEVMLTDRALRRLHGQIVRRQRALRAVVNDDQWRLYMLIEELFNDRWALGLALVAKALYEAGTRVRRSRRP